MFSPWHTRIFQQISFRFGRPIVTKRPIYMDLSDNCVPQKYHGPWSIFIFPLNSTVLGYSPFGHHISPPLDMLEWTLGSLTTTGDDGCLRSCWRACRTHRESLSCLWQCVGISFWANFMGCIANFLDNMAWARNVRNLEWHQFLTIRSWEPK
jgi:hypothetical protein